MALLSATEGEDKPLKYPSLFNPADAFLVSKIDLEEVCEFDLAAASANLQAVRPEAPILETSGRTGAGFDAWIRSLPRRR